MEEQCTISPKTWCNPHWLGAVWCPLRVIERSVQPQVSFQPTIVQATTPQCNVYFSDHCFFGDCPRGSLNLSDPYFSAKIGMWFNQVQTHKLAKHPSKILKQCPTFEDIETYLQGYWNDVLLLPSIILKQCPTFEDIAKESFPPWGSQLPLSPPAPLRLNVIFVKLINIWIILLYSKDTVWKTDFPIFKQCLFLFRPLSRETSLTEIVLFKLACFTVFVWASWLWFVSNTEFACNVCTAFVCETCRDLQEKCGSGGGRHSEEGPDCQKLA